MVSVLDPESGDLVVHAVSGSEEEGHESVRYTGRRRAPRAHSGGKSTLALPRLGDEPRFLNRLGLLRPTSGVHCRADQPGRQPARRAGGAAEYTGRGLLAGARAPSKWSPA